MQSFQFLKIQIIRFTYKPINLLPYQPINILGRLLVCKTRPACAGFKTAEEEIAPIKSDIF